MGRYAQHLGTNHWFARRFLLLLPVLLVMGAGNASHRRRNGARGPRASTRSRRNSSRFPVGRSRSSKRTARRLKSSLISSAWRTESTWPTRRRKQRPARSGKKRQAPSRRKAGTRRVESGRCRRARMRARVRAQARSRSLIGAEPRRLRWRPRAGKSRSNRRRQLPRPPRRDCDRFRSPVPQDFSRAPRVSSRAATAPRRSSLMQGRSPVRTNQGSRGLPCATLRREIS